MNEAKIKYKMSFKRGERRIATCYPQSTCFLWNSIFQSNMMSSDIQKECPSKNCKFLIQYPSCHSLSIAMAISPSLMLQSKKDLNNWKKVYYEAMGILNDLLPAEVVRPQNTKSWGYKWVMRNEKGEPINPTLNIT